MSMSPLDRKIGLLKAGVTQLAIAERLGVTVSHVSAIVRGARRSPRVEQAVAEAIHRPVADVFPPRSVAA